MKKLFTITTLAAAMLFTGMDAQAQNENALKGQAIAAFNQECDYQGAVEATDPVVISACFAGGFVIEVNIIPKINCNQVDCSLIRIGVVGRVHFFCDNSPDLVECFGPQ